MYLTTQRVIDSAGHDGVSVFAYTHDGRLPGVPTVSHLTPFTMDDPGRLVFSAPASFTHGGSAVVSFLDVLAPDSVPMRKVITEMLDPAVAQVPPGDAGTTVDWSAFGLALRFYARPGFGDGRFAELRGLRDYLRAFVAPALRAPRASPESLQVHVTTDETGTTMRLAPVSMASLRRVHGRPLPAGLRLPHDTRDAFETMAVTNDPFREYAEILTQLPYHQIESTFGIVFLNQTGTQIWPLASV